MALDRRGTVVARATIAALIGFGLLWHARADDVRAALALFPIWGLAACVLLHLLTLVADVPIFLLEVAGTAGLLAVAGELWALPLAVAPLAAGRALHGRLGGRPSARGLRVLADDRLAVRLAGWVGVITGLAAVRVWLTLSLLQLPSGASQAAATFASLGFFGLLPLGPTAPAAGTLASSGSGDVVLGLAAGAVIAASTLIAVAIYAGVVAALSAPVPRGLPGGGRSASSGSAAREGWSSGSHRRRRRHPVRALDSVEP